MIQNYFKKMGCKDTGFFDNNKVDLKKKCA